MIPRGLRGADARVRRRGHDGRWNAGLGGPGGCRKVCERSPRRMSGGLTSAATPRRNVVSGQSKGGAWSCRDVHPIPPPPATRLARCPTPPGPCQPPSSTHPTLGRACAMFAWNRPLLKGRGGYPRVTQPLASCLCLPPNHLQPPLQPPVPAPNRFVSHLQPPL